SVWLRPRCSQDCRHQGREQRRNGCAARSNIWLERWSDGVPLHKVGRSQAASTGRDAHACERKAKIYPLTFGSGEGPRAKTKIKSEINFCSGGPGRTRTSNQAVMSR